MSWRQVLFGETMFSNILKYVPFPRSRLLCAHCLYDCIFSSELLWRFVLLVLISLSVSVIFNSIIAVSCCFGFGVHALCYATNFNFWYFAINEYMYIWMFTFLSALSWYFWGSGFLLLALSMHQFLIVYSYISVFMYICSHAHVFSLKNAVN